jgi:hypothetical protein
MHSLQSLIAEVSDFQMETIAVECLMRLVFRRETIAVKKVSQGRFGKRFFNK